MADGALDDDGGTQRGGAGGGGSRATWSNRPPSQRDTYRIAHTARCKLQQAANRPDRDLRFILGHAFTLDNLLLRIVEIENSQQSRDKGKQRKGAGDGDDDNDDDAERASLSTDSDSDDDYDPEAFAASLVLKARREEGKEGKEGKEKKDNNDSDDDDDDDDGYDDDDYEEGLGLQRFASASARQPRQVPCEEVPALGVDDDNDDDDEGDESWPPTPPTLPEEVTRKMINEGEEDAAMRGLYNHIRNCHCRESHGQAPEGKSMKTTVYEGRHVGVLKVD